MPTNYEEILKKVQIYEEGKVGGRNKMQIQDEHLSEFIRITDEKLKRTIDITWNEARADTANQIFADLEKNDTGYGDIVLAKEELQALKKKYKVD